MCNHEVGKSFRSPWEASDEFVRQMLCLALLLSKLSKPEFAASLCKLSQCLKGSAQKLRGLVSTSHGVRNYVDGTVP